MSLSTNVSIRLLALPPSIFCSPLRYRALSFLTRELVQTSPVHPNPWHDTLCHHKPYYIFPQNNHHTYLQGISISFSRYFSMQHSSSHDLIFHCHTCFCLIIEPHVSWG